MIDDSQATRLQGMAWKITNEIREKTETHVKESWKKDWKKVERSKKESWEELYRLK